MADSMTVTINEMSWTQESRRKERPCTDCKELTRGMTKRDPMCLECAMKQALQPLKYVRAEIDRRQR